MPDDGLNLLASTRIIITSNLLPSLTVAPSGQQEEGGLICRAFIRLAQPRVRLYASDMKVADWHPWGLPEPATYWPLLLFGAAWLAYLLWRGVTK